MTATRADVCALAIAECFRGDGERLCNPIGNLPLIGGRLAAASYSAAPTTAAIRTELSVELARLDASVSSRLAPAGTLARVTLVDTTTSLTNGGGGGGAPSAAQVATAVRTELTPELARVANCSTVDTTATAIQDAVGA